MKKSIKITQLIVLLFIYGISFAQTPPITDGLIGYWPFKGSANDVSGYDNNGEVIGAVLTTDRFGYENSAYRFNTGYDYIKFPLLISSSSTNFTISLWINHEGGGYLFGQYALTSGFTDANHTFNLVGDMKLSFDEYMPSGGNLLSNSIINSNEWTHIVVTRNGTTRKIYINGQLDGTQQNAEQYAGLVPSNAILGARFYNGSLYYPETGSFKGTMDDLIVYNRELSQVEITELYNAPAIIENNCTWSCDGINMVYNIGNIGIGTNTPDQKLTVKGKIHTEEVLIDLNIPAPDYVFDKGYPLSDIEEVESFISENKHLPEIPSAKEIAEKGLSVGEMNMKLLQKIEELTLYAISQNKETKALKEKVGLLEYENKRLKKIEKRLNEIETTLEDKEEATSLDELARLVKTQQETIEQLKEDIKQLKK